MRACDRLIAIERLVKHQVLAVVEDELPELNCATWRGNGPIDAPKLVFRAHQAGRVPRRVLDLESEVEFADLDGAPLQDP